MQYINTEKTRKELYADYIVSDHWQNLRQIKLIKCGRKCEACGTSHGLQVHHLNYRNWTDCTVEDLMVLCRRCHKSFHAAIKRNWSRPEFYTIGQTITLIRGFTENQRTTITSAPNKIEKAFASCRSEMYSKQSIKQCISKLKSISKKI